MNSEDRSRILIWNSGKLERKKELTAEGAEDAEKTPTFECPLFASFAVFVFKIRLRLLVGFNEQSTSAAKSIPILIWNSGKLERKEKFTAESAEDAEKTGAFGC